MPHFQSPQRRFSDSRKGFGQKVIQGFAPFDARFNSRSFLLPKTLVNAFNIISGVLPSRLVF
jgi:hypothetical protein